MNNNLLQQMQLDLNGSLSNHTEVIARVLNWNAEIDYRSYGNETQDKAKLVSKDIAKAIENAIPSLTEPFLNKSLVMAQGQDAQSDKKAEVASKLLNYQWNYGTNVLPFIERLIRDMLSDGTVVIKSSWNVAKDMPTATVMNLDSLIIDASAETLEDARFVVERKKVSISEILAHPSWYGSHTIDSLAPLQATSSTDFDKEVVGQDSSVNFEDRLRQLIEINIYYGELSVDGSLKKIIGIWSNEFLINVMESPYPNDWNHPFSSEVFSRVSGSIYGESIAELLSTNQKVRTGLTRAILDTLDASTNGQKGVKKGALDIVNKRKFNKGDDFEYLTSSVDIWQGQFNEVPASVYALLDRVQEDSEELSGISRMNGGLDSRSLNSGVSATASSLVNSNAERRLLLIAKHISSLLENVFRKWLDLNMLMLESGSVKVAGQILSINGFDIEGNYDILLNIATSGQKQEKGQQLSMVLQTLASNPNIPQSIIMRLTSELVGSMDMYETEEELKNLSQQMQQQEQQPQEQDPMEGVAMQLDLAGKQAQIAETNSKAELNQAKTIETFTDAQNSLHGL